MSSQITSADAREAARITPMGLIASQAVVGAEIAGEEIDKMMANNGAKPFQNATDLLRVGITVGPLVADLLISDRTKAGRAIDKMARPMVYGGIPLLAKTLKYAVWTWMGKPPGTKASGINRQSLQGGYTRPDITVVRGSRRPAASSYSEGQAPSRMNSSDFYPKGGRLGGPGFGEPVISEAGSIEGESVSVATG